MKKNTFTIRTLAILTCVLTLLMCGCGASDSSESPLAALMNNRGSGQQQLSLAVVGAGRANEPDIPLNSVIIRDAVYKSCYTYGTITLITVEGSPRVYFQTAIPEPEVSGLSTTKKKSIAEGYTTQVLQQLGGAAPETAEADTLKAITLGGKALQSASVSSDKKLLILDNGIPTTGYLNLTNGLLLAKPEDIVEALQELEAIPSLEGVEVIWMYLGQTASPQAELSERQKHRLQEIWRGILEAGGAASVDFLEDIASGTADRAFPDVSTVAVEETVIDVEIETPAAPVNILLPSAEMIETKVLDSASVSFIGDRAEFIDYDRAYEVISACAADLLAHPDRRVYVIGTTATGGKAFCDSLSRARAEAVTEVLTECGVPAEQLIPMGLGFEDPWHVPDLDDSGRQIEESAKQNRKVLILDTGGDDAKLLNH
ncbi:MAG: OmpA family protein [Lachnospiraceae bacterium]|nr:OmpA family protein [Lachnospiraceae bacterium]